MADKKTGKERKREKKQIYKAVIDQLPRGAGRVYLVVGLLFFVLLFAFTAVNLFSKDKKFSEKENRMLAQKPQAALGNMADGRFMEQYEEYRSDQFAGRDFWVQIKTLVDSFSGKKEENGVFNGRSGYLLEDIKEPDEEDLKDNLEAMKAFQQKYSDKNACYAGAQRGCILKEKNLPAFAVTADQSALMNKVRSELGAEFNWIDVEKTMKNHADEDIYYRTDHHWTTLGAYYAFQDAAEALGIPEDGQIPMAYRFLPILTELCPQSAATGPDIKSVYIYLPESEQTPQIVVNYVEEQKKTASLYDSSKLEQKDKYAMFLGGNHALVDIKSDTGRNERLLVIKDSYAIVSFFLAPYYREILVVKSRYYTGDMWKIDGRK